MQCLGILETIDIVETAPSCIVRNMQTDAPIDTNHEETEIVAQADTCAEGYLSEETVELKL